MANLMDYIKLCRPQQWYKNVLVFAAIFFTGQFFNVGYLWLALLGFIALSLTSSAGYIINDIKDLKADRAHPEKRLRPLASGRIGLKSAVFISIALIVIAFALSILFLPVNFVLIQLLLFVLTQIYSFVLKNEPILDVILISVNFVLRAVSGVFIINVIISPWFIIGIFFLALFLVFGKRRADMMYLGSKAADHKKVFNFYTKEVLDAAILVSTSALLVSYSLYSFLRREEILLITLPIVFYGILRYLMFIYSGSEIGRHPEKVFKDWRMIVAMAVWIILTAYLILYY